MDTGSPWRSSWGWGILNRNGSEFFKGDDCAGPEHFAGVRQKLFPDDVNYMIGKSDFRKDWFFQHENPPQHRP